MNKLLKRWNMKKILVISVALIIIISSILGGIFYLDYMSMQDMDILCLDMKIEDVTENKESSFVRKIKTCKKAKIEDEKAQEDDELKLETEGFELQGEISYDGDDAKTWDVELGEYKGLTYYSQLDSRWKDKLYTVTGDKTQTIGRSGCGPTVAAMIVSSIKGEITPDEMAKLFLENGYRSPNNGTYWSAFRAVADEFNIGYEETANFNKALELLRNNNYIVVSCGNGLFTTGGHYIVLVGIEGDVLQIYDPYLYNGKFRTSTRRGKVVIEGNTVYCTIDNFRKYANYKNFFCYERENKKESYSQGDRVLINVPVGIAYIDGSRVLVDDGIRQFWVENSYITDNRIYGEAIIAYNGGDKYIVQLGPDQLWCKAKDIMGVV